MSDINSNEIPVTSTSDTAAPVVEAPAAPTPPAAPAQAPASLSPGRIVLYVARKGSHMGLEGGVAYPAIVVRSFSDVCATLAVLTESSAYPVHTITSVLLGDQEGTWRWPTRS